MKKRKALFIIAAGIVAVPILANRFLHTGRAGSNAITVSGNIEVTDAEVSFKIPGRVERRFVSEGETVRTGQIVAQLDRAELAQEVALRNAEVKAIQAALAELEAGSRPEEIAQAEAAVTQAQATLQELLAGSRAQEIAAAEASVRWAAAEQDRSRLEFEHQEKLLKREVISRREFETAQTAYEIARAKLQELEEHLNMVREGPRKEQIDQARARLVEAGERLKLIQEGPRKETIDQTRAKLQQAKEALALAETRREYSTVASPLDGLVLSENVEAGEYVSAGTPIVTVARLDTVWVRAYIDETDLGRVQVGQQVRVTTDTYPGKEYAGRISFIASSAEFTPKNVQTQKERVKLVYRIKIDISNPNLELKPGMPADADILLSSNS